MLEGGPRQTGARQSRRQARDASCNPLASSSQVGRTLVKSSSGSTARRSLACSFSRSASVGISSSSSSSSPSGDRRSRDPRAASPSICARALPALALQPSTRWSGY